MLQNKGYCKASNPQVAGSKPAGRATLPCRNLCSAGSYGETVQCFHLFHRFQKTRSIPPKNDNLGDNLPRCDQRFREIRATTWGKFWGTAAPRASRCRFLGVADVKGPEGTSQLEPCRGDPAKGQGKWMTRPTAGADSRS